jgi:hypothetical protein
VPKLSTHIYAEILKSTRSKQLVRNKYGMRLWRCGRL